MTENIRKVTSRKELDAAIRANYHPLMAGVMLGNNQKLKDLNKMMEGVLRRQVMEIGYTPTARRPAKVKIETEAKIREFFEVMEKNPDAKMAPEEPKVEPWQVNLLIDMFNRHPWDLEHFDSMRQAGKDSNERFELARRIHESDIKPAHLELAVRQRITLHQLLEHVEAGEKPENLLRPTPIVKERKKPKAAKPSKASPQLPATRQAITLTDPALRKALARTRQDLTAEPYVPQADAEVYRTQGISEQKIPLAHVVQQLHRDIHGQAMPSADLKHWIEKGINDPDHILFLRQVQMETGEKPDIILHAIQSQANDRALNERGQNVMKKARKLSAGLYRKDVLIQLLRSQRSR